MSAINEQTRDFWQKLAVDLEVTRPSVGKRVRVDGGRKYKGREGFVVRHQLDRYSQAYRYGSDASAHMRDLRGRAGWVCQIESGTDESGRVVRFWVRADYLTIV